MLTITKGKKLAEGKTKIIWEDLEDPSRVLIESKDDITAGDGAKRDELEGKAVAATTTACNIFELLERNSFPTHYFDRVDERTFSAVKADMIPLELVVRRVATGSYLKRRPDVSEGTIFDPVMVEFFEKDDELHDPLIIPDIISRRMLRFDASRPLGEGFIGERPFGGLGAREDQLLPDLRSLASRTFLLLEEAWARQSVQLVDLKIECGKSEYSGLVVADVIDNDSWRIWPAGDKTQMKDKQVYRDLADTDDPKAKAKELGKIKDNYAWVAEATKAFVPTQ